MHLLVFGGDELLLLKSKTFDIHSSTITSIFVHSSKIFMTGFIGSDRYNLYDLETTYEFNTPDNSQLKFTDNNVAV